MSSMTTTGAGGSRAALANGDYWYDGVTPPPPIRGAGWIAGSPQTSSGANIIGLRVQASAAKTGISMTSTYKGDLTVSVGQQWNGTAWANLAGWFTAPPSTHAGYTQEVITATFTSVASTAFIVAVSESDVSGGGTKGEAITTS
jgi:hypothetical protein